MTHVGATDVVPVATVVAGGSADLDGLLESEGDEAGEEEGAEGVHVESNETLGGVGPGGASLVGADKHGGGVGGGVPIEADEDREGEE